MKQVRKKPSVGTVKKTIHKGRHLIFKLRSLDGKSQTKNYSVLPLPPKVATKGHSAGAESFHETVMHVQKKLKPGKHVAGVDGSPALHKAASTAGVASIPGVAHLRFLFTPLGTIPKSGLDRPHLELLRRLCQDNLCKERRDSFVLCAGDNAAESVASVSKKQLRRLNLLSADARDAIEHRNLLAVHRLNKKPGLISVMEALALFRRKASQGLVSPATCFQKPLWSL